MITIHLREVHYKMVIKCYICRSFASMNAQSILDHCSGCKAKCDKECAEHEGQEEVKSHRGRIQSPGDERRHSSCPDQISPGSHKKQTVAQHLLFSPAGECKLVHFLNLCGSSLLNFWVSLCSAR